MLRTLPRPVFDADPRAGGLGDLPEWDLSDLYTAQDAPELLADLAWLQTACADFAQAYEGKLAGLDGAAMLACIRAYERIEAVAGRIMSFAGLRYYQNTLDSARAKFMSDCQDQITDMTTGLVFFTLEFNRIADETYARTFAASPEIARYRPVFDRMRAMKIHKLTATYKTAGSRSEIVAHLEYGITFRDQIECIKMMQFRFLRLEDSIDQYFLELYATMAFDLSLEVFGTS